jgi:hypothetical protein
MIGFEQLGGILLLEAKDLNPAIELMLKHPGVRVRLFEIRPADEQINAMIAARSPGGTMSGEEESNHGQGRHGI